MAWSLFGVTKESQDTYAPSFAQNIHQPFETYAPTTSTQTSYNISPQYSYGVQISSPNATMTTKKEDSISSAQSARQDPYISTPSSAAAKSEPTVSQSSGISSNTIMIVAVAAVAGLFLLKRD